MVKSFKIQLSWIQVLLTIYAPLTHTHYMLKGKFLTLEVIFEEEWKEYMKWVMPMILYLHSPAHSQSNCIHSCSCRSRSHGCCCSSADRLRDPPHTRSRLHSLAGQTGDCSRVCSCSSTSPQCWYSSAHTDSNLLYTRQHLLKVGRTCINA